MQLKYFKQSSVDYLKANIASHVQKGYYKNNNQWLNEIFNEEYAIESGINVPNIALMIPKKQFDVEFENCKIIYDALKKDFTLEQAADERLWTCLCYTIGWEYMIKRWPVKDTDSTSKVCERYMFKRQNNDRALLRNGLSRLWWMAYTTYDENREDPYELTAFLLKDTNLQQQLMERAFSRNKEFTKLVLTAIKKYTDKYTFPSKEKRAELVKGLNRLGGVKVLDMITYEEIEKIVYNELQR
ncbi:hypothetical protein CGQ39_15435 [Clostridium botulinum]|uniref:DUF6339 family protein n=1 Tax=Clostridium botulinum TaxID=1491 RepID=UPI00220F6513|nr:DUF6339 family protein [Clostridium botulinum]QDY22286.1 hypothetical protein CGQ39_15435 [Clostridium botulinum]